MDLPEEIFFKILSYLPGNVLRSLELSNKQYWNIYRNRIRKSCAWDENTVWIDEIHDTNRMNLKKEIYITYLTLLQEEGLIFNKHILFNNEIEVVFKSDREDDFFWVPPNFSIAKADCNVLPYRNWHVLPYRKMISGGIVTYEILYETENTKIIKIFEAYLARHLKASIYKLDSQSTKLEMPWNIVSLYLTTIPNFDDDIELEDELRVKDFIIWKVLLVKNIQSAGQDIQQHQKRTDIGRAVLPFTYFQNIDHSSKIHVERGRIFIHEEEGGGEILTGIRNGNDRFGRSIPSLANTNPSMSSSLAASIVDHMTIIEFSLLFE